MKPFRLVAGLLFLVLAILTLASKSFAFAATSASSTPVHAYRVFSLKQLTPHVDRVFHADGGAFADIFCRADAAEALFVDSRVPELDGKVFHFKSVQACEAAKATIRRTYRRCVAELYFNSETMAADVQASRCR